MHICFARVVLQGIKTFSFLFFLTFLHCRVSALEVVIATGPVLSFSGGKPVLDDYPGDIISV